MCGQFLVRWGNGELSFVFCDDGALISTLMNCIGVTSHGMTDPGAIYTKLISKNPAIFSYAPPIVGTVDDAQDAVVPDDLLMRATDLQHCDSKWVPENNWEVKEEAVRLAFPLYYQELESIAAQMMEEWDAKAGLNIVPQDAQEVTGSKALTGMAVLLKRLSATPPPNIQERLTAAYEKDLQSVPDGWHLVFNCVQD